MRADDFVIETIAHYVKGVDGPPPGVPFHVDAQFETKLVNLCHRQQMSLVVSESLDRLVLPPTMSRITIARIKNHASELTRAGERRKLLLSRILRAFGAEDICVAVMGDAWVGLSFDTVGDLRAVDTLDLLIDEFHWGRAVAVLRELGFVRSRIQPRLAGADGPSGGDPVEAAKYSAEEALGYYHYFSPLVMHNLNGDNVRLRFRVIAFGHPEPAEPAWTRVHEIDARGTPALALSREDQLIHTVVDFGAAGFIDLPAVMDAGLLVSKYSGTLDWKYVTRRLRAMGLYSAFYFSLEHVCELLRISRVMENLAEPGQIRRRLFNMWWRVDDVDYTGDTEPMGGQFLYYLVECGGIVSKAKWLRRSLFPKPAWVKSLYGRPSNPWLRLKFLHDVRRRQRRRVTGVPAGHHSETTFTGYE